MQHLQQIELAGLVAVVQLERVVGIALLLAVVAGLLVRETGRKT